MPVAPTLADPHLARVRDRAWAGAIQWSLAFISDGPHLVLPDLCVDIVWIGASPRLIGRTTTALRLPASTGELACGVRLPASATAVVLDPDWQGWHVHDSRDQEEKSAALDAAVRAGALSWRIDPERAALLHVLDQPGVQLPEIAAATDCSPRTLRRRCQDWFGTTGSDVVQVLRLWRFAEAVRSSSLAVSAHSVGFVDQQHAARSLGALTGLRPTELTRWATAAGR
jgi:AraC-like DNA-binding protein